MSARTKKNLKIGWRFFLTKLQRNGVNNINKLGGLKHLNEIAENFWDTQLSGKVNFFEITYEELRRLVAEIEIDGLTQVEINIISGMLMEMVEEFLELVYGEIE